MTRYTAMTKKELRHYIRHNNLQLRKIADGSAHSADLFDYTAVLTYRDDSMKALDELYRRGATFEDKQLYSSIISAYYKAAKAQDKRLNWR